MRRVDKSPEHGFMAWLGNLAANPEGWQGLHFEFSRMLDIVDPSSDLEETGIRLRRLRATTLSFAKDIKEIVGEGLNKGVLYIFKDGDILVMSQPLDDKEEEILDRIFDHTAGRLPPEFCHKDSMEEKIERYQKLAENKVETAKMIAAYDALSDQDRQESLPVIRHRRERPLILVVEDDSYQAAYCGKLLAKNHDVIYARNGEEAITAYLENAPDVVFLDIHLPGIDGLESLKNLKRADPDAHIIMISADSSQPQVHKALDRGAIGYVKKPFTQPRLEGIAEKAVRKSRQAAYRAITARCGIDGPDDFRTMPGAVMKEINKALEEASK